jgi:hypothetical protein
MPKAKATSKKVFVEVRLVLNVTAGTLQQWQDDPQAFQQYALDVCFPAHRRQSRNASLHEMNENTPF